MSDDDKKPINPVDAAVPSDLSDHDERSEGLAVEKHWDEEEKPDDALATAEQRLKKFREDGVPLSDEDWEKEEELDDEIPDHIDAAIDTSLEELAEEELEDENEEEI